MGICSHICPNNKTNYKKGQNDINNINQTYLKNKSENNISPKPQSQKAKNNNSFPKGTKYEESLNLNFKNFDVFWYDPNNSNDYDNFINCFENVRFYKSYNLDSTIKFFKNESMSDWIVVTPGSKGEELIKNLENFECIKAFFVYCENTEFHEKWAKKIKKVGCITSNPEILCKKFLELNDEIAILNFNYGIDGNVLSMINDVILKKLFDFYSPEFSALLLSKIKKNNKFYKFCIKSLDYLNSEEYEKDLHETMEYNSNSLLNLGTNIIKEGMKQDKNSFLGVVGIITYLTSISLYFHQYPFLFNILSFQEVKTCLEENIPFLYINNFTFKLYFLSEQLFDKIGLRQSILEEKECLKDLQISILHILSISLRAENIGPSFFSYYQIINFLRDIDFCLKIYLISIYSVLNNNKHVFIDELISAILTNEPRYVIYSFYFNQLRKASIFTKEEQNIINETLTIKDFIIPGDKIFHEKIKRIEKNIKSTSFKYLNIEQIPNYLEQIKREKGSIILPYFYFLIIRYEEFVSNFENIVLLSFKTGITFLAFLYIENANNKKINKNHINFLRSFISIIIIYSPNDILFYLSQKLKFFNPLDLPDLQELVNIKIPKITFEQYTQDDYQDGCFELAETFNVDLIKNKLLLCFNDGLDYTTEFTKFIYNIYKEHNALDLFYHQSCLYLGWNLYPEFISLNICFIKRFLYMYCREELPSQKSLYRIMNDDLRTRDPYKIYPYVNIVALINEIIQEGFFANYEGKVYRATKLDEKLIMKLIPGVKMVNTSFWSTSKDFKVVEGFMIQQNWRNSFIICKTNKNNIDIDFEKLNPFNEKEVLFLPFTEFVVEKVSPKIKYGKKVFIIELIELENRNFVNIDNMQIHNINSISYKNAWENFNKKNRITADKLMYTFKSLNIDLQNKINNLNNLNNNLSIKIN